MSAMTTVSALLGVAIALWCGWYCRRLAPEKGRGVLLWTVLGFAFNVVAVPVLMAMPAKGEADGGGG